MLDWFISPMHCSNCNADSPTVSIQTHFRGISAEGAGIRVGFEIDLVDLATDSILGAGYALIHEPDVGGPIRLLEVWSCASCPTEQWAMIEISDRRVREICAATLDRSTLLTAHFISDYAEFLADSLRSEIDGDLDTIAVLKRRLP